MDFVRKRPAVQLTIAPLIDIIFNLLLFFMLTYQVSARSGLPVELAPARTASAQPRTGLTITVTASQEILVGERFVRLDDLPRELARLAAEVLQGPVQVRADEKAAVGVVVRVMDCAREAGIKTISIETRPANAAR